MVAALQHSWAARQKHLLMMVAAPKANARVAAIPYQPIAANASFVSTVGTQFVLSGKLYYPGGTNWCGIVMHQAAPVSLTCSPYLRVDMKASSMEVARRRCGCCCIVSGAPHAWHPALTPDCHAAGVMTAVCVRVSG
jgi:hypothetical protein